MASKGGGANVGNIAGWIAAKIRGGATPAGALKEFRDAGGAIRTQRWYQLFNESREAVQRSATIAGLAGNRRPSDDLFTPWQTRRPGLYAYQIQLVTRDRETGDTILREHTQFYDRKVSPDKAIADALGEITNEDGTIGTEIPEVVEGGFLKGLFQTVPITGGLF